MPTLDWLNRAAAFDIGKKVPYRLLEAVSEHRANVTAPDLKALFNQGQAAENIESRPDLFSALEPSLNKADSEKPMPPAEHANAPATEDNLLIQGDNLEALKALLPFYRGQVKCIFIDPPYNTKSAFEHYDDNLEHAQWLSMMLPRLQLLRELLSDAGSIWVTIDDNEGHYLKVMMDEVFGRGNFVSTVIWQKIYTVKNSARFLSEMHDYVHCYAKSADAWHPNHLPRTDENDALFTNSDKDPRGPWTTSAVQARNFYGAGTYEITSALGRKHLPPSGTYWRVSKINFDRLNAEGRIWWGKDGTAVPRIKRFLSEVKQGVVPTTLWLHSDVGHNAESKEETKTLFEGEEIVFTTPKPERLLQRIVQIGSNPNDLILDSFLGSGTTAAVAQKMGRRWIGIEMGEHAKTHCLPRLQKVLDGEQGGISKAVNWQGGGSFRFVQLGAPVFDEKGAIHPAVRFATLAAFIWMQETRTPLAASEADASPRAFLGTHNGVDYFLLFNGVLGDRRPQSGNVLTRHILDWLTVQFQSFGRPRVVYGEANRLGAERLAAARVQFKALPHDVVKR